MYTLNKNDIKTVPLNYHKTLILEAKQLLTDQKQIKIVGIFQIILMKS